MNYTNIRNLCKQYNINMFNDNGKLFKYNNLRNKINDHENKNITYHKNRSYIKVLRNI